MNKPTYKPTIFRKILNDFEMGDNYNAGKCDYWQVHKWYERLRKKIIAYYNQNNFNVEDENYKVILSYFLAIYLEVDRKEKYSDSKPFDRFSIFINGCFHNILPPTKTKTGKRYIKTITFDDMSFFLCFFKADSEITQKLGYQLTEEQNNGIERLIANTTLTPEEKFQELMLLFYTKK